VVVLRDLLNSFPCKSSLVFVSVSDLCAISRVATYLENLEKSGIFKVWEMLANYLHKAREIYKSSNLSGWFGSFTVL